MKNPKRVSQLAIGNSISIISNKKYYCSVHGEIDSKITMTLKLEGKLENRYCARCYFDWIDKNVSKVTEVF